MFYITGGLNGGINISKLEKFDEKIKGKSTKDDYVIICGDFGIDWDDDSKKAYEYWLYWLHSRNWQTLFVDGSYENFENLYDYKEEIWNGGRVHKISSSIFHLIRGEVYTINNLTFFAMGGATSIGNNKPHKMEKEEPSSEDIENALRNLEKHNYKVNCVITHTCPKRLLPSIEGKLSSYERDYFKESNINLFLDSLLDKLDFDYWFFGKFPYDMDFGKFKLVNEKVRQIYII